MLGGTAGRFCSPAAGSFRLCAVTGFQNRVNDIVYCPPIIRQNGVNEEDSTAVVYFGGDVQDFPESMETNRDSRGYMKYNLENTAILLRSGFPKSHIIVVRPVRYSNLPAWMNLRFLCEYTKNFRMEFKTFSCFDNFVRGNNAGVPDHTPMNHALQHLERLLQNISQRLKSIPESEILAQTAAAAAAASAMNNSDITQDMDIDILQVQETVTVESDGAMIFPCGGNRGNNDHERNNSSIHSGSAAGHQSLSADLTNEIMQHELQQHFNNVDCQSFHAAAAAAAAATAAANNKNPLWWRENLNLDKSKLILIGFSKGCVVLNQFIYEFHYLKTLTPDDSTMIRLLSRIKDMYWLDGGHGGQKNTWITSRSLLETLTRLGINIHVHVTPYQVQDERRPWIRKEEKQFSDLLRRLGAPISRHLHFDSTIANLFTHFEILQAFCQHMQMLNSQQHLQIQSIASLAATQSIAEATNQLLQSASSQHQQQHQQIQSSQQQQQQSSHHQQQSQQQQQPQQNEK